MKFLVVAICMLVGFAGRADAEKVRTNQATKIYSRPGEQSKVVGKVKSGQNMTLVAKSGRWLKVKTQGVVGFVPRSKVDMADEGGIARNTRRRPFVDGRSKRRGFGGDGAPEDRLGGDAIGEGPEDEEEEEEEEEDEPKPKKAVKAVKAAKVEDEDEDEEEEDEEPAPKAKKIEAKPKKPKGKASEEDEEEEEEEEDEEEPTKSAKGDDEEEEDPIDDSKTAEPEEAKRATARVGKKVSVYEDADAESPENFVARPSDILYPVETKGDWTFVENDEGDAGWVLTSELEMEGGGGGGTGKRVIDMRVKLGLMFIQQAMRTQGSTITQPPDNYNIGTSAVTLSAGGGILMPFKKKFLVGGEITYDYAKTLLGGVYYDADGMGANAGSYTQLTVHNINVRGMFGLDFKKASGMALIGRLGYRYQGYLVSDYANAMVNQAKLPSEVVKAPTLGAALSIPRLTNKLGLRASLDSILAAASVKQTVGLEDGANPSVLAVVVGAAVTYRFKPKFHLQGSYDLQYMGIDFGTPPPQSMRGHTGTTVTRTDFFHLLSFGVAMPF